MEISFRNRVLVGVFATVIVVGSGVATALVTSGDAPIGSAADTSTSTGGSVDTTTPSTPDATTPTAPTAPMAPNGTDDEGSASDGSSDAGAVYWDPAKCGGDEVMNHGQYVSSQPKGGESRSTAAQSDCGKPLTAFGDDGDDADDGDESQDTPDAHTPEASGAPSPSASPGKSGSAPGHNK